MNLPKVLITLGFALMTLGVVAWGLARLGVTLGRLPGDIRIERESFRFYFPWVSCLLVSALLTLTWRLVGYFRR